MGGYTNVSYSCCTFFFVLLLLLLLNFNMFKEHGNRKHLLNQLVLELIAKSRHDCVEII